MKYKEFSWGLSENLNAIKIWTNNLQIEESPSILDFQSSNFSVAFLMNIFTLCYAILLPVSKQIELII